MEQQDVEPHIAKVFVRPKAGLTRAGTLGAVLVTVGLFVPLYLVTVPHGPWVLVVVLQLLCVAIAGFWLAQLRTASVEVADRQVVMRVFPHRPRRFATADVASILMADVYVGDTADTHRRMVTLDSANRCLFPLRGKCWAQGDMMTVAAAIGAPVETVPHPVSRKEFRALYSRR